MLSSRIMDALEDRPSGKLYNGSPIELQEIMHEQIPMSRFMGVEVCEYDGDVLTLTAPLDKNINHQKSAFGGSVFALAALAGWGILQLKLHELGLDCNTVVGDAKVKFLRPIREELVCKVKVDNSQSKLLKGIEKNGSAVVELNTEFFAEGLKAMTSRSIYHIKNLEKYKANE